MSAAVYIVGLAFIFVLGVLETLVPRRLDGLMGRILGPAYGRSASERTRVRWIRMNGLFLLVLCAFMSFALGGRS